MVVVVCASLCGATRALAQSKGPAQEPAPRIASVVFTGTRGLSRTVLRDSIVTQATRCRTLLLKPLCLISSSPYVLEKHYLDRAEIPRDELRIRVMYFRAGYRETRVSSTIAPVKGDVSVTFHIDEGPATTVSAVNIQQVFQVLPQRRINQTLLPRTGERLNLSHIDSAKLQLRAALWDRGYGDAVVRDSSEIDAAAHTAVLNLVIDPVHRTTIDTIAIEGNKNVETRTIRRLLDLHEGGPYRRSDMIAAQRRLYETEIFRQTLVAVPDVTDSAKTVTVTVREAPFRAFRAGLGFNTAEFVQAELKYTIYNFLGGARRVDIRAATGNLLASRLYGKSIFGNSIPLGIGNTVDGRFLDPNWEFGATFSEPTRVRCARLARRRRFHAPPQHSGNRDRSRLRRQRILHVALREPHSGQPGLPVRE